MTSGQGNSPTSSHKIGHRRHNRGCSILASFPLIGAGRTRPFAVFDQNQSMTSLGARLSREGSESGNHAFEKTSAECPTFVDNVLPSLFIMTQFKRSIRALSAYWDPQTSCKPLPKVATPV